MTNLSLKKTFLLLFITTLGFAYFLNMNTNYPFYFIWDMDHTTVVDLLLIQNGELPDHINHTGYGMYFFLKFLHLLSAKFGLVSIFDLSDLSSSIQPILAVAELTDFIRRISPALALSIVMILGISLARMTNRFTLICLGLLSLLTLPSLLYHSAFVRSELYSIFFFAVSVCFILMAASTPLEKIKAWIFFVVGAGFFAGLSYLTKFQGVFYFIFLPIFFYYAQDIFQNGRWNQTAGNLTNRTLRRLAGINFVIMLVLIFGAIFRHARGATFTQDYGINIIGIGYIAFSSLLFFSFWTRWNKRFQNAFIHLYFFGFHLAFLSHFFMYAKPSTSVKYLLLDAKMIFFRNNYYQSYSRLGVFEYFKSVLPYTIEQIPFLFFSFVGLAALHFYLSATKQKRALGAVLTLVILGNTLIASRGVLRDLLWMEVLLCLGVIVFSFEIVRIWKFSYSWVVIVFIFITLIFFNAKRVRTIPIDTDANFNNYGWLINRSYYPVYQQHSFHSLMQKKYNLSEYSSKEYGAPVEVSRMARNYVEQRRVVKFTFPNLNIGVKNIGYFYENAPIDSFGFWRVKEFSPELKNAVLVDSFHLPRLDESLMPNAAAGANEGYTKIERRGKKHIGVLNRPDYAVYLFLPEDSINAVKGGNIRSIDLFVELKSLENKSRRFKAVEIFNYIEIDPFEFSKLGFFAVLPKN